MRSHPEFSGTGTLSWNTRMKQYLGRGARIKFEEAAIREVTYRPFCTQVGYMAAELNDRQGELPLVFPTTHHRNFGIVLTAPASHFEFTPFFAAHVPDLHLLDTGQFFPRWTYEKSEPSDGGLDFGSPDESSTDEWGFRRVDNISDGILALYCGTVGDQVTKDDIFFYVYGLLHDPAYRETYASDLKKMLPHIPTPDTRERFEQLASAGRRLADLHVDYEAVDPYPLDVKLKSSASASDCETWRVSKMKWGKKKDSETGKNVDDRTTIIYSPKVTIAGIPEDAERYMLGSRSALAWIIDRYQVKADKASGIVNDPNDWCDEHDDPTYIVDLIKRVTTVAVETMKIVDSLG
ncbi:type ISP restriction/modification enzyme [Rhodococcus erythropolis]|uniref:type ISP restriction/modification enzyme n=1 Tax=Rhodococcus erythropolis TaxID=1833 RepID=UPI003AF3A900